MNFIERVPVEILEEIFSYLPSGDLIRCSLVSLQWREVANSNKLWSVKCMNEGIHDKKPLEVKDSLFTNPSKMFKEMDEASFANTRLSPISHWRRHFQSYKFLQRNWRRGRFCLRRTTLQADYFGSGLLVKEVDDCLDVYSLRNLNVPMKIKKHSPNRRLDCFLLKDEYIIYSQKLRIICWKYIDNKLKKLYEVTVPSESRRDRRNFPFSDVPSLKLRITKKSLVAQNSEESHKFHVYNFSNGTLERTFDVNKSVDRNATSISFFEVFDDKFYLCYKKTSKYFIAVYDYLTDKCEVKVEAQQEPTELEVSKNFFVAKIPCEEENFGGFLIRPINCELHVWSSHTGIEVALLFGHKNLPVILTADDRIVYFTEDDSIFVRGLITPTSDIDIMLTHSIDDMIEVWPNLLLVSSTDSSSLDLWDLHSGLKLVTLLRCDISEVSVDEKCIVTRTNGSSVILSFW